jgi:hypothetical protein
MIRILNILTVHAIISARVAFAVGILFLRVWREWGRGGRDEHIAYNLA